MIQWLVDRLRDLVDHPLTLLGLGGSVVAHYLGMLGPTTQFAVAHAPTIAGLGAFLPQAAPFLPLLDRAAASTLALSLAAFAFAARAHRLYERFSRFIRQRSE